MGSVSGPFGVYVTSYWPNGRVAYDERRSVYKQAAPRDNKQPLPYKAMFCQSTTPNAPNDVTTCGDAKYVLNAYNAGSTDTVAQNRAYDKFISKMHDSVSLGLVFAERRETVRTLANRALTLRKAWLALRAGRFKEFLKVLDTPPKKRDRGVARVRTSQAARYWLEYWLGWAPLVGDIYASINLLDSPYPTQHVEATGGNRLVRTTGYQPYNLLSVVKIRAEVLLENPMLYRANQFGIVNPAAILWGATRFSFLVDWFIPVGTYLRSYTDFVGLSVRNASYTKFIKGVGSYDPAGIDVMYSKSTFVQRVLGIPGPVLRFGLPARLSVTRAATAVSLLISSLRY